MATTVQKGAKINFYKFVGVGTVSTDSPDRDVVESINKTTLALNNLGSTVNSISSSIIDLKKSQLKILEAEKKNNTKFEPKYTKKEKKTFTSFLSKLKIGKIPNFFEAMLGLLGNLFKLFVVGPALEWISKKENQQKVKKVLEVISNVLKFVKDWAVFGVTNTIEGLYTLLSDESTFGEKFGGFIRATVGIGSLLLGIRWLTNPLKIISDFGSVLKLFFNSLNKTRRSLMARKGLARFGGRGILPMIGRVAVPATALWLLSEGLATRPAADGTLDAQKDAQGRLPEDPGFDKTTKGQYKPPEKAQGGILPQAASGGWINGPQSGYPVSLDGGRSTSFIGHGSEYVARKSNGGAFVVPFNTPATKTQPNLTSRRMGEAKSQGFSLPGFSSGGNTARSGAPSIKLPELPEFSRGGNLDKQIYLHWTATDYNYKKGPYNAVIQGDGKVYNDRPSDQVGGEHTWRRNSKGVGISMAAMSAYNWDSYGPKPIQIENMSKEAANVAKKWGWKPSDINIKRVMNHAEAASNKDGKSPTPNYGPTWWNGTGERSDLHKLKKSDKDGTGGDKLRAKIRKYMGGEDTIVPTAGLNPGDHGPATTGGSAKIASGDYALLQKLVLAEAGGEGHLGMALVARSVLNRAGLVQKGIVGPGIFMAESGSVKDIIMADNGGQYTPAKPGGSLFKNRSDADMLRAQKAIETARNPTGLRGYLESKNVPAEQINYLMGSTGFRNYDAAFTDPSQQVNEVKFGNHTFNTASNPNILTPVSEITGHGGTGGGHSSSPLESTPESGGYNYDIGTNGAVFTPSSADSMTTRLGVPSPKSNFQPGVGSNITSGKDQFKLQRHTQEVTTARQQTTQMQKDLISAVLTQVAGSNQSNNVAIQKANKMIQEIMSSAGSSTPTPVTTGSSKSDDGSTASLLNSFNNPLRGAFK
ncbi:hypothetical protein Syn7803C31_11 [Synechococcus phage ACG-2014a]|uniref:N-acetylmuramoyl-L-alanine amidase domain-containing protein n=1 Tax=Synechococcus phage ACG-2014a TaxID=1493507 RepID=A0A0E3ICD5_9CAUD|nr:hypothetical protein Syn7803C31_11 [Synechococcus phage ACG-2014a]